MRGVQRSVLSAFPVLALAAATSGCFSLDGPIDLPEHRAYVRGASTGPHVFFAVAAASQAFDESLAQTVLMYDLKARAVHELPDRSGAFVADGERLYAVQDGDLVRLAPRPGGKVEREEVVAEGVGADVRKVVPAGENRFALGYEDGIRLLERGPTPGEARSRSIYGSAWLDFSYDAAADSVWVIEESGGTLAGVSLAATPPLGKGAEGTLVPKVLKHAIPDRWRQGPDPVVAGARFLVVFDRLTSFEQIFVIDKETGKTEPLAGVVDLHRGFGLVDVACVGEDRFLIAHSAQDGGGEEPEGGRIYEVDLAARTIAVRARLDEPIYSIVPDPEGLVVGARAHIYLLGPDWRVADERPVGGLGTSIGRGAAMAANATITSLETAGVVVGGTAAVGLAIATAPVWVPLWLLFD